MQYKFLFLLQISFLIYGCGSRDESDSTKTDGNVMNIKITSSAFQDSSVIPLKYACEGDNISPPLSWTGIPNGTKSLAIICDDPDAPMGIWTHWIIYNIPPDKTNFDESIHTDVKLADGSIQGANDFGDIGYSGPCPPAGYPHRYYFTIYALDVMLSLKDKATRSDIDDAIQNHILGKGQLIGTFSRKE
jgi:Raf kinase inhibitor-like YbhB/YbcL family protein